MNVKELNVLSPMSKNGSSTLWK